MKAAVEGLLRAQDLPGEVVCSQPGAEWAPAGSVVQLFSCGSATAPG
ncbi:hypothetical protein [Streptomyces olivochromogenes]